MQRPTNGPADTREDVTDRSVECPADERRRGMTAPDPALRHALDSAYAALLAGDTTSAAALLQPHLTAVPESTPPDAVRGEAATLWANLLVNDAATADRSTTALAVRWARYGAATARQLHGNAHWATLRARRVLAEVLTAGGEHAAAADAYAAAAAALLSTGEVDEASAVAAPLAGALHAAGRCADAIERLSGVWDAWQAKHGNRDPRGLPIVLRLTGLLTTCGFEREANRRWTQARPALPPQHTVRRVAVLTDAYTLMSRIAEAHPPVCAYRRLQHGNAAATTEPEPQ
ncbi:hypothetical protein ACFPIJ_13495 [Dactylosporangium cerinum]|uniref:Uncharacterized protein n=1 Tax=Dactylosporangium cerinum TaxID=1434730 RepID=A0ABV9VV99_9ACTN